MKKKKQLPEKKKYGFEEIFLPLELYWGKVFANGHMAFDFPEKFLYANSITLSDSDKNHIVDILNGKYDKKIDLELTYKNNNIYAGDHEFIIIRGWGHLTGCGALNLPVEEAARIQDDFANYIISKLN